MQLNLFEESLFRKTADELCALLNMDRTPKEAYKIHYYYKHNDYYILIAINSEKDVQCNIVDKNGNIPKGFCVNWRNHELIFQELNLSLAV